MGWLYPYGISRRDLITDCLRSWHSPHGSSRSIAHCTRGNVLWVVWEQYIQSTGHFERFIICILLQRSSDGWGYKDMDESTGPYYWTCPLKYLKMAPRVFSKDWREGVQEYHVRAKARRLAKNRLTKQA